MDQRVKDISLDQITAYSQYLAHKISDSGWIPGHIIYVERAGLFVGYTISTYFLCGISGIYCSRAGTLIKSKMKTILRILPRAVTHLLRDFEIMSNIHSMYKERKVYMKGPYPPQDKNLLIVDDAIDTGYSAAQILSFLLGNGYHKEQIKIAVLTNTKKNSACLADISLFDHVKFAFPWSFDSREYKRAWKLYDEYKSSIFKSEHDN
jgi:hypoxanthine phosphoribosyltransferase